MASLQDRVVGALSLNPATFEEVEADATATPQAAIVVAAAALASGIGVAWGGGLGAVLLSVVFSLIAWPIGSFVVLMVGTKLLPGKNTQADMGQMLRVLGFAQAPGLANLLGFIPLLGWLIRFAVWIWSLVAMVIAVKHALDYDDAIRAVIVCVIAAIIQFLIASMAVLFGIGGAAAVGGL